MNAITLEKSIGEETISNSELKNIRIISDIPYLVGQSKVSKIDAEIGPEAELKDSSCLAVCPVIIKPHESWMWYRSNVQV